MSYTRHYFRETVPTVVEVERLIENEAMFVFSVSAAPSTVLEATIDFAGGTYRVQDRIVTVGPEGEALSEEESADWLLNIDRATADRYIDRDIDTLAAEAIVEFFANHKAQAETAAEESDGPEDDGCHCGHPECGAC